jgi:hypothetical protein
MIDNTEVNALDYATDEFRMLAVRSIVLSKREDDKVSLLKELTAPVEIIYFARWSLVPRAAEKSGPHPFSYSTDGTEMDELMVAEGLGGTVLHELSANGGEPKHLLVEHLGLDMRVHLPK